MTGKQKKAILVMCIILVFVLVLMFKEFSNNSEIKVINTNQGQTNNQQSTNNNQAASESNEPLNVDKKLLNVDVTIPSTFFENTTFDEVKSAATEKGIKSVKQNDDGSITYTMSKSLYSDMLEEIKQSTIESINSYISDDYPSIIAIEYNDNFSKVVITVDKDSFESGFDSFSILGIGIAAMYYQVFEDSNLNVDIEIKDNASKEIYKTVNYPEALQSKE